MISLSCLPYTVNSSNPHVHPENGKKPPIGVYDPQPVESFLTSLGHREAGGCTEIRIFPKDRYLVINGRREYVGKTVAGYYTDYAQAARDIAPFSGFAQIYATLNPCDLKLMRRAHNRLQFNVETTATDKDIIAILWVPLDLDPVRPKGTSSSDSELAAAILRFDQIHSEIFAPNGVPVIRGMSGNGAHGLIRLHSITNSEDTQAKIKPFLDYLSSKYSDDVVNVDRTVGNPSRIWKLYGTMACKGDNTPEAPHRRASVELLSEIEALDLNALVALMPESSSSSEPNAKTDACEATKVSSSDSKAGNNHTDGRPLSDAFIIGKLLRSRDGAKWERLLNGDPSDYPSKSEADPALVFKLAFYTKDPVQLSRLFRQSGLMYDKWDEVHYADGRTYGQKIIDDALAKVTGQYDPNVGSQKHQSQQKSAAQAIVPERIQEGCALGLSGKQSGSVLRESGNATSDGGKGAWQARNLGPGNGKITQLAPVRGDQLLDMELPEPKWAVEGLIPQGLSMIGGRPKVGKSWLAFDSAIAVASGGYVLGQFPAVQGEALFIGLEDTLRRLQDRLQKLSADGSGETPDLSRLYVETELSRGNAGLVALENWLKDHPDCRLVVIDTLARFLPPKTGRRSEYDEDYDLLAPLQQMAHAHEIALVVIHHTRKVVSDNPIDDLLGSTGLSGVPDGLLIIRRTTDGTTLHVTGKDVDTQDLAVRFEKETGHWWYLGDAETHAISKERKEILDLLAEVDEPMTPSLIAQELGKKRTAVQMLLTKMARQGVVRCVGRGKYVIDSDNHTGPDSASESQPGDSDSDDSKESHQSLSHPSTDDSDDSDDYVDGAWFSGNGGGDSSDDSADDSAVDSSDDSAVDSSDDSGGEEGDDSFEKVTAKVTADPAGDPVTERIVIGVTGVTSKGMTNYPTDDTAHEPDSPRAHTTSLRSGTIRPQSAVACGHHENPSSQQVSKSQQIEAEADAMDIEDVLQISKLLPELPPQAQRIVRDALKVDIGTTAVLNTIKAAGAGDGKFAIDKLRRRTLFLRNRS